MIYFITLLILLYNHRHNILRLFATLAIFFSPQVKQSVTIISNKHSIYELPHGLSNDLRL